MRRPQPENMADPGHDSFLDIVANIVGILIILVMVTGLRVRDATVHAASADEGLRQEAAALEKEQATAGSLRQDILSAAAQIQDLTRQRMLREEEREHLAAIVAAWEHKIRSYRDQLDAQAKQAYDLQLAISQAEAQLEQLQRDRAAAAAAKAPPIRVESYPTPLSKPVDGDEAHFQLRGGLVAFIPLQELMEQFKDEARQKAPRLLHQEALTDTVGPTGGFRLRYTLMRREITDETAIAAGRAGMYATLTKWTLIPSSGQLGEPIDAALAPASRFRGALAEFDPDRTTVTIWTYPDSFAEFRRLKQELYHLGFPTAARPLPYDVPIGGSPQGTKSAAE
jgi:hypothetical protein